MLTAACMLNVVLDHYIELQDFFFFIAFVLIYCHVYSVNIYIQTTHKQYHLCVIYILGLSCFYPRFFFPHHSHSETPEAANAFETSTEIQTQPLHNYYSKRISFKVTVGYRSPGVGKMKQQPTQLRYTYY